MPKRTSQPQSLCRPTVFVAAAIILCSGLLLTVLDVVRLVLDFLLGAVSAGRASSNVPLHFEWAFPAIAIGVAWFIIARIPFRRRWLEWLIVIAASVVTLMMLTPFIPMFPRWPMIAATGGVAGILANCVWKTCNQSVPKPE